MFNIVFSDAPACSMGVTTIQGSGTTTTKSVVGNRDNVSLKSLIQYPCIGTVMLADRTEY